MSQSQSRGLQIPSTGLEQYGDKMLSPEEVILTKIFENREIARREKEEAQKAERRMLQASTAAIIGTCVRV